MAIGAASWLTASLAMLTAMFVAAPAAASGSPADRYAVLNGTVNAATDHEILGSSAFPNFTTGAVDNYYSLAHAYLDSSPFAEGTSSPADTGPIGQTAAAGNFQQPQYADARWPGNSGKATVGNKGGPYAVAKAGPYEATATCSEASNGSGGSSQIVAPKGFSRRLHRLLTAWKARWLGPLHLRSLAPPVKRKAPAPPPVTVPGATVPGATVPTATVPSSTVPTTTVPTVTVPKLPASTAGRRSFASYHRSGARSRSLSSSSGDGGGLLESSTSAGFAPNGSLDTKGESSLARVSLGNGQIVIEGIHVSAEVVNGGTPTATIAVHIGGATIGGVPVTIDQGGVAVAGHGQGLPYKQADDALNAVLKQAGVELYTVQPELQKNPNEDLVTATGVHVKFTQPVHQGGVPDQYAEHILGEVFVDSLAVPAGPLPQLNLSGSGSTSGGGTATGGTYGSSGTTGFGSTQGGTSTGFPVSGGSTSSTSSGFPSSSGGGASQSSPMSFLSLRNKPVWLLVGYLVWQALVIGTGVSLRNWRTGGVA